MKLLGRKAQLKNFHISSCANEPTLIRDAKMQWTQTFSSFWSLGAVKKNNFFLSLKQGTYVVCLYIMGTV